MKRIIFSLALLAPLAVAEAGSLDCNQHSGEDLVDQAGAGTGFDSACDEPVKMVTLLVDTHTSPPFKLVKARIQDDVASLTLQYNGGCGDHDFDLNIAHQLLPGKPAQAPALLTHTSRDNCDARITREQRFDLLPLRELYQQQFGQGPGSVTIQGVGVYSFE